MSISNKEILEQQLKAFDCENMISEDGRLYKAILAAMEPINPSGLCKYICSLAGVGTCPHEKPDGDCTYELNCINKILKPTINKVICERCVYNNTADLKCTTCDKTYSNYEMKK